MRHIATFNILNGLHIVFLFEKGDMLYIFDDVDISIIKISKLDAIKKLYADIERKHLTSSEYKSMQNITSNPEFKVLVTSQDSIYRWITTRYELELINKLYEP